MELDRERTLFCGVLNRNRGVFPTNIPPITAPCSSITPINHDFTPDTLTFRNLTQRRR
ncbi:unnamed protein product, partial [Tenebrio molitor]